MSRLPILIRHLARDRHHMKRLSVVTVRPVSKRRRFRNLSVMFVRFRFIKDISGVKRLRVIAYFDVLRGGPPPDSATPHLVGGLFAGRRLPWTAPRHIRAARASR
jgi:hypothetical protein